MSEVCRAKVLGVKLSSKLQALIQDMFCAENMGARQLSPEPDSRPPTGMADVVPKPRFAHTAVLLQGMTPGSLVCPSNPAACP